MYMYIQEHSILYSWKYWWEINLAVGSQIAIANVLAVQYGIAIHIYMYARKKF